MRPTDFFIFLLILVLIHVSEAAVGQPGKEAGESYEKELSSLQLRLKHSRLELIGGRVRIAELERSLAVARELVPGERGRVEELEQELVRARRREKQLDNHFQEVREELEFFESIKELSEEERDARVAAWGRKQAEEEEVLNTGKYVTYQKEADVMYVPPSKPCIFAMEEKASTVNDYRKDTKATFFFGYTDVHLEPYFPKRDFITCYGYVTAIKGLKILYLNIAVATPKAPGIYGEMIRGLSLQVNLLNGETVRLINQLADKGVWDPVSQAYHYQVQYPIGIKEEKILEKSEVDHVKIEWSRVSDKFEVFEVDFFKYHIGCLNANSD